MGSSTGLGVELVTSAGAMRGVPQIMVELEHACLMQLPSTSPLPSERGRDAHVCIGARVSVVSFFHMQEEMDFNARQCHFYDSTEQPLSPDSSFYD